MRSLPVSKPLLYFGVGFLLSVAVGCAATKYSINKKTQDGATTETSAPVVTPTDKSNQDKKTINSDAGQVDFSPSSEWKRSNLQDHKVRLLVNNSTEVPLTQTHLHIKVDGFRARVLLDMQFAPFAYERAEATFQLRLANNANPYYLAFGNTDYVIGSQNNTLRQQEIQKILTKTHAIKDIQQGEALTNVAMREARFTSRKTAAKAYHETVRRAVDPALLEWAGGGVYNGRVFPLSTKSDNRIIVAYDVDLVAANGRYTLDFSLPYQKQQRMINVDISKTHHITSVMEGYSSAKQTAAHAFYQIANPEQTSFRINVASDGIIALNGHDGASGNYFAADWVPKVPIGSAVVKNNPLTHTVFLLDVSHSREPARFNRAVLLLKQLLARNADQIKTFNVLFYSNRQEWLADKWLPNTQIGRDNLNGYLPNIQPHGKALLSQALRAAISSSWALGTKPNALFILSEDDSSVGDEPIENLARFVKQQHSLPVYTYNTSMRDSPTLNILSKVTNGASFHVTKDKEVELIALAHRFPYWRISNIKVSGINDVLVKGGSDNYAPGQSINIAGRGKLRANAFIEYSLSNRNGTRRMRSPIRAVVASSLAPRVYGQIAVENMLAWVPGEHKLSGQYAEHFRIVSPQTSMVMLESEQDFGNYGIHLIDHTQTINKTLVSPWIAKNQFQTIATQLKEKIAESIRNTEFKIGNAQELTNELLDLVNATKVRDPKIRMDAALDKNIFVRRVVSGDHKLVIPDRPVDVLGDNKINVKNYVYYLLAQKKVAEAYYLTTVLIQSEVSQENLILLAAVLDQAGMSELALAAYELALQMSQHEMLTRRVYFFLQRLQASQRSSHAVKRYAGLRAQSHEFKGLHASNDPVLILTGLAVHRPAYFQRNSNYRLKVYGGKSSGFSTLFGSTLIYENIHNYGDQGEIVIRLSENYQHYIVDCGAARSREVIVGAIITRTETRFIPFDCATRVRLSIATGQ